MTASGDTRTSVPSISGVVRLADRPVREVMTPRTDIDWLDCNWNADEIRDTLLASQHTRLPVGDGSIDRVRGVVQARVLAVDPPGEGAQLRDAELRGQGLQPGPGDAVAGDVHAQPGTVRGQPRGGTQQDVQALVVHEA